MSALTYEIQDPHSPVALWMREMFPYAQELQAVFREKAGPITVMPTSAVAPGTQGAAIDWWLRMLVDSAVPVDLAMTGLKLGRVACTRAGVELLEQLGALDAGGQLRSVDPSWHSGRSEEWWARVCYALALFVELYRALSIDGSRLMSLSRRSGVDDLLGLANEDEVCDLIATQRLARERLLPYLPAGPVATGMTFEGSNDLAADADLVAGGMLVDFKAGRGRARKDGSRWVSVARSDLHQLLGYVLMDYSDVYAVRTVGLYGVRFGYLGAATRPDRPDGRRTWAALAHPAPPVRPDTSG